MKFIYSSLFLLSLFADIEIVVLAKSCSYYDLRTEKNVSKLATFKHLW